VTAGRPSVSIIVPFLGSDAEAAAMRRRLQTLAMRAEDELIVSDNRAHPIHTPAYARNRAAERATGDWLVFLDADTAPGPQLLDAYFDPPPSPETAVLAGAIDDAVSPGAGRAARHAVARGHMSHRTTLDRAGTPYAQTANCAVLRSAFVTAGGFTERARAGEDADLCFRLMAAGWGLEERPHARVEHLSRPTAGSRMIQIALHGSGAAWLERRWPGEFPPPRPAALAGRLAGPALEAARASWRRDWEAAAFAALDIACAVAFELGRLIPNTRRRRIAGARTGKPKLAG